jgi:hypothetical protein
MDPVEVAARNAGEFFIDRISGHRGVPFKIKNGLGKIGSSYFRYKR